MQLGLIIIALFIVMKCIAVLKNEKEDINKDNPYIHIDFENMLSEDMRVFVENMPEKPKRKVGLYEKIWKKMLDNIISFLGLIVLSPFFIVLIIWIKIDDPGPAFFRQKRVGKDKKLFFLHKFRSMKMSTPSDTPTHLLEDPEQYITKVGKFLRKSSLDELPQIWDIFRGKMSIIGPRPALWNQGDLIAEREKYAANDVMPGLTGLAQINGRDELEIIDKARFDGKYCEKVCLNRDVKCFFDTIFSVIKKEGIVEGGTGKLKK